jgi:hypothetical protein
VEDGEVVDLEHRALDVCRWTVLETDITGVTDRTEAIRRVREGLKSAVVGAGGRALAVRVKLSGDGPLSDTLALDLQGLREEVLTAAVAVSDDLWIERVALTTTRPTSRPEALKAGVAGMISQDIAAQSPEALAVDLERILADVREKLPAGARPEELFGRLRDEAPGQAIQAALCLVHGGAADAD